MGDVPNAGWEVHLLPRNLEEIEAPSYWVQAAGGANYVFSKAGLHANVLEYACSESSIISICFVVCPPLVCACRMWLYIGRLVEDLVRLGPGSMHSTPRLWGGFLGV